VARFAAWVHESDERMVGALERRGYTLDTSTRAMGMALDDIAVPRHRECGRTPGYPHGHDDIHLLKLLG
jgi:hypothetical protein